MTTPNPPPPFDADAARRLASLTDFEQSHLWWDRIKADIRAAVAEVERLREALDHTSRSTLAAFREKMEEIDRLTQYKTLFNHALDCVDRVFQVDGDKPPPLLPDFLGLGCNKFEGVIKLAEAYRELQAERDRLRERVKELEASVERVAGDDTASLNAGLSLPNLQVTRDLRDLRDSRDMT
jgi:DNA repair exonuclease SbcCD ATPase subunit